jgi:hypothetical protein
MHEEVVAGLEREIQILPVAVEPHDVLTREAPGDPPRRLGTREPWVGDGRPCDRPSPHERLELSANGLDLG